jgi:LacI family transcriptional regulator, kdg operon repressor
VLLSNLVLPDLIELTETEGVDMMREKRVTIEEVAVQAGVSIATVSNYLNQKFGAMSEATKDRIAEVVNVLNYRPNALAQGLKANKSRTIAVVVVNIGYPFCVSIIRSLSTIFAQQDYRLLVCETGEDGDRERKILESLLAQQVEAIVIQATGENSRFLSQIAEQMPLVLVDREYPVPKATQVVTNNLETSAALTMALFQKGYVEVAFVTEHIDGVSTRSSRLAGYQQACRAFGKDPVIFWVNRDEAGTFDPLVEKLKDPDNLFPIAVYTANGLIMQELYPLLLRLEKQVPNELGLATFDNPDWAKLLTPPLTAVNQPTTQIGEFCANTIISLLKHERTAPRARRVVLNSSVLLQPSTDLADLAK